MTALVSSILEWQNTS